MAHTPHELTEEFPDLAEQITSLKTTDKRFAKLANDYHDVNRAVHRAETNVEPTDDFHAADLRKQRAALKDEIYKLLTTAA